jgi:molybdenum storage protein
VDRKTIASPLADSALTDSSIGLLEYQPVAVMPDVKVVKLGGQSLMDRGRAALFPVLDEIVAARKQGVQVLVLTGGGTRARHIYSIASELDMPTGVLAALGGYVPMQNARMVQMLLAKHGGIYIMTDDFEKLPLYIQLGCIPVMTGMPPFGYWEKREEGSRIPPNRTDAGAFLSAEFLGCPRAIFIKDEDGMYTHDPKKDSTAKLIARISAQELIERNLPDMILERVVVRYLTMSKWTKECQVVNGLKPEMVRAALRGEDVGTIVYSDS